MAHKELLLSLLTWKEKVVECRQTKILSYHFPEEGGHLAAVLQNGPDEERGPGKEAALLSVQAVSTQQLTGTLGWMRSDRGP